MVAKSSSKLSLEEYEKIAREIEVTLHDLPEDKRKEALELFRSLDDKVESLLSMKAAGFLPTHFDD